MKRCPYCAEEVQDEAVLCRFCGRRLDELLRPAIVKRLNKWFWLVPAALLVLGGIGTSFARRQQPERCLTPAGMSDWAAAERNGCDVAPAYVCQNLRVGGLLLASVDDRAFVEFKQEHGDADAIMVAIDLVRTQRRRAGCPDLK